MAIEAIALNADTATNIVKAAGSRRDLACILEDIHRGHAEFIRCQGVYFVLRPEGDEMVVVISEGKGLKRAAKEVKRYIETKGFLTMRFHASRRGISRILEGFGFAEVERVYRAEV